MKKRNIQKAIVTGMSFVTAMSFVGCANQETQTSSEQASGDIVLHILENDTAKSEGYLQVLLDAFNAAYADQGIQAVDANMDEFSDLAQNGPYGYGPDVIYQANDKLMTYAEDKHILALDITQYDCEDKTPQQAWDAFQITMDGKSYCCGVPVNVQEPMLFYREDQLPEQWETQWDKNQNQEPDFFENWNDLYAYSKYLRETDESAMKDSQYGFMSSLYDVYMSSNFIFSYGGYVFGETQDGAVNSADIGFDKGNSALGLQTMKQFAGVMNEGCIDDTIKMNRYEKLANGTYFCTISTPDTYVLFHSKLALHYEQEGLQTEEAEQKATQNLKMIELPRKLPKDGDLSKDSSTMTEDDWVDNIVMGGVNGYGISAYSKYPDACKLFVDFATSYEMIQIRMQMLGIAPTRSDVAEEAGGVTDMIFQSLNEERIYLMPSVKAVNQIWDPMQTLFGDVAKDAFRMKNGEQEKYADLDSMQEAATKANQNIYDAIYTLAQ